MEGDLGNTPKVLSLYISIHALRVEGDPKSRCSSSLRKISIHALRVEGDRKKFLWIKAG